MRVFDAPACSTSAPLDAAADAGLSLQARAITIRRDLASLETAFRQAGLDPAAKEALFSERRQYRSKDKPVIRWA